jgi:AcrR family transcriptional regulator
VLERHVERGLTPRQRQVLERLGEIFDEGFGNLVMADLASRANCSLRTLYELAPTRDELVLTVVDRNLWRMGRLARDAITPDMGPIEAIRAYLGVANLAVSRTSEEFARDLDSMPAARRLRDDHAEYLVAVTKGLLDLAVEQHEIEAVDTNVAARVIASLGRDFARPDVIPRLGRSPKDAADLMIEVIIRGLTRPVDARSRPAAGRSR